MGNFLQAPRGTLDVVPADVYKWQYLESVIRDMASLRGFHEIRFPTFEYTELFSRGVGETTDVVQKEMYTFEDRGGRSVTLRPEGTASTVRAVLQNGLHNGPLPLKLYYIISCFRGERPQAGRLREFHQFGAELFGTPRPEADAEVIGLALSVFDSLGLKDLRLEINSIGCPDCRKRYHEALRSYFSSRADELCPTCQSRLERNPMRILDCKSEECKKIAEAAPVVLDYICDGCRDHFEKLKKRLDADGVEYTVNPRIVRGLDYYTRTVFEFIDNTTGLTACGGGRYDGLVRELNGPDIPALGFGMGLERVLMLMEANGCGFPKAEKASVYIAPVGEEASARAAGLADLLRREGFAAEYDLSGRSVKAQMKYADKLGFGYAIVLGDEELQKGRAVIRNMKKDASREIPIDEGFIKAVYKLSGDDAFASLQDAVENIPVE